MTGSGGTGTLIKKYDGSVVNTVVNRADVQASISGSGNSSDYIIDPMSLWVGGGRIYFIATVDPSAPTYDLFTFNGTSVVRATQLATSSPYSLGPVFELDGVTYFFSYVANDPNDVAGYAFDTIPSSGRRSSTVGGVSYYAPQVGSVPILSGSPDRAYFLMNTTGPNGMAVVTFDGTTVAPVTDGTGRIAYAGYPTVVGSRVYFPGADSQSLDDHLWFTSGTTATKIIKAGASWNIPSYNSKVFGALNDSIFLFIMRGQTNYELWRTDGTTAGTDSLADLGVSSSTSDVSWLYSAQGELFFASFSDSNTVVRKTDGTVAGTTAATGLGTQVALPRHFSQGTNSVFFYAITSNSGIELHGVIPTGTTPSNNSGSNNGSSNTPSDSNSSGSGSSNTNTNTSSGTSQTSTTTLTDAQIAAFKAATLLQGSQVIAGQTYTVSADGFSASETVNGYLKGTSSSVGSASANSVGKASVSIKIPSNVSGKKTLYLHGARSGRGVRQTITINKAATVLPATGNNVQMVWMAVLTLAAGIGVTGAARRKRTY